MLSSDADWQRKLSNLFGAYVNQQSLADAARRMALLAVGDAEAHNYWLCLFSKAKELVAQRDSAILTAINESGYYVDSFADADEIVSELEAEYLSAYASARP